MQRSRCKHFLKKAAPNVLALQTLSLPLCPGGSALQEALPACYLS